MFPSKRKECRNQTLLFEKSTHSYPIPFYLLHQTATVKMVVELVFEIGLNVFQGRHSIVACLVIKTSEEFLFFKYIN